MRSHIEMPNKVTLAITEGKLKGAQFPNGAEHQRISRYHCLLDINTMEFCDRDSVINLRQKCGGKLSVREATDIIL